MDQSGAVLRVLLTDEIMFRLSLDIIPVSNEHFFTVKITNQLIMLIVRTRNPWIENSVRADQGKFCNRRSVEIPTKFDVRRCIISGWAYLFEEPNSQLRKKLNWPVVRTYI